MRLSASEATLIAEGDQLPESGAEYQAAWQTLIDTGIVWQLQVWFGRTAETMIEQGFCLTADAHREAVSCIV